MASLNLYNMLRTDAIAIEFIESIVGYILTCVAYSAPLDIFPASRYADL